MYSGVNELNSEGGVGFYGGENQKGFKNIFIFKKRLTAIKTETKISKLEHKRNIS